MVVQKGNPGGQSKRAVDIYYAHHSSGKLTLAGEIVVFITTSSLKEARTIGKRLVGEKLAACVNIVPVVESIFSWQGKVRSARECLLV
ncbi:MAG TPA: divalent cation tolerance protein CutA, partial [Nitrospiria bacterium]